ncbi:Phosphoribosylglycinamide formyltransferase [Candidatus Ornithobacterium hominis]|uniref:formyltransferase family protein n=1 Tax=Candidatus Ornithobacterium hominis TaxID=2497989 RepID=UPI0024BD4EC5|nr:formyltransferase family protein [Candidatus Ornithobacterium hominis]CAI9430374.1 Phosphoribosylglycinamide formyltransferase [Candidatus Ornithobacterium hominis]
MKIAVLVSGGGTNLQEIIDAIESERLFDVEIACVIADRSCFAIERALNHGLSVWQVERNTQLSAEIDKICIENEVDVIVMAGFLSIISAELCEKWERRIINLHPSLLPKYGGKGMFGNKVLEAVLENKEEKSGATVHYVTAGVDEGDIISQMSFEIPKNANLEWMANKLGEVEKPLLIAAIDKLSKKLFEKF